MLNRLLHPTVFIQLEGPQGERRFVIGNAGERRLDVVDGVLPSAKMPRDLGRDQVPLRRRLRVSERDFNLLLGTLRFTPLPSVERDLGVALRQVKTGEPHRRGSAAAFGARLKRAGGRLVVAPIEGEQTLVAASLRV